MTRPSKRPLSPSDTYGFSPTDQGSTPDAQQLSRSSSSFHRSVFSRVVKSCQLIETDKQLPSEGPEIYFEPSKLNTRELGSSTEFEPDDLAGIDIKYNDPDLKKDEKLLAMMFASLGTQDAKDPEEPTASRNSQSSNPSSHQNLEPTTSFQALDRDPQQRLETSPQQTASQRQSAFVRPTPSRPLPYSAGLSFETTITQSFQLNPNSGFRRPIKPIAEEHEGKEEGPAITRPVLVKPIATSSTRPI